MIASSMACRAVGRPHHPPGYAAVPGHITRYSAWLPWRSLEAAEFAILAWLDRYNTRRLRDAIGNIPTAEAGEHCCADMEVRAVAA